MSTTRQPVLAMSPQALPVQRLYLVADLPELPDLWTTWKVDRTSTGMPQRMPRRSHYLGQVEWAWSPVHNRVNAYYLSQSTDRHRWVLWVNYYDDNWDRWATPAPIIAASRCGGLKALEAAQLMLLEYWAKEKGDGLDAFHWVAEVGELSVPALRTVSRAVWEE